MHSEILRQLAQQAEKMQEMQKQAQKILDLQNELSPHANKFIEHIQQVQKTLPKPQNNLVMSNEKIFRHLQNLPNSLNAAINSRSLISQNEIYAQIEKINKQVDAYSNAFSCIKKTAIITQVTFGEAYAQITNAYEDALTISSDENAALEKTVENFEQKLSCQDNVSDVDFYINIIFALIFFLISQRSAIDTENHLSEQIFQAKEHAASRIEKLEESLEVKIDGLIDLVNRVEEIKKLPDNWNGNNAVSFSDGLIDKAKEFLSDTSVLAPYISIFPTANNSIQIEWESSGNIYCEAEIFSDSIEIYAEKDNIEFINERFIDIDKAAHKFISIYNSEYDT